MCSAATSPAGTLESRATEIERAIRRAAERFGQIPVIETTILRLLVLLGREISANLEISLRPHGLNETDFRSLMMLFGQPDGVAHPSDLCAYAAQSPANMTRVADSLCERGLITRIASDEDRRRTILRMTREGEALALALLPDIAARTRAIFSGLSPEGLEQLLSQIHLLMHRLDLCAESAPGAPASAEPDAIAPSAARS